MITIATFIEQKIKQSPYIEEALSQGILNFSAYARQLKPEIEKELMKDVTEGAIVMALKRWSIEQQKKPIPSPILSMAGNVDIIIRSNLIELTYANSPSLQEKQKQIFELIGNDQKHFIVVTHGVFETTFLVSQELKQTIDELFEGENQVAYIPDLSSLTIRFKKVIVEDVGCYYYILKLLAWNGLNVIEAASTYNEITLFLWDKDIDRAFSILKTEMF